MITSGDLTEIRATLFSLTAQQGETNAELRNIHRILQERGEVIKSIDVKLDMLSNQHAVTQTRMTILGSFAGLVGGGFITWLARVFSV